MWVFRRAKSLSSIHERSILYTFLPAYHNKNTIYNLFHFLYMSDVFSQEQIINKYKVTRDMPCIKQQFESIFRLNLLLERQNNEFSGLASMPKSFLQKFKEDYSIFVLTMFSKIIYYTFREQKKHEEFLNLAAFYYSDILNITDKSNKNLQSFFERKSSSMVQHFCMLLFRNRKFDIKLLKQKYSNVDLSYHRDFHYNLNLELYVLSRIPLFFKKHKLISIDPNAPVLSKAKIKKQEDYRVLTEEEQRDYDFAKEDKNYILDTKISQSPHDLNESESQLLQKNSDLLEETYFFLDEKTIAVFRQYFEIKNDSGGPLDGRLVICPGINRDVVILKKFINNFITCFNNISLNEKDLYLKSIYTTFVKTLKNLTNRFHNDSCSNIYKDFINEILTRITDLDFRRYNLSIPLDSELDHDFIALYHKIEPLIKANLNLIQWDVIFPDKNYKEEKNIVVIKNIITKIFPKELQKDLLENVDKFFNK
jgi:hypothetical protein